MVEKTVERKKERKNGSILSKVDSLNLGAVRQFS
jgi:hypothetical protein